MAIVTLGIFVAEVRDSKSIWPSVFLEVGAGLALAGVLFLLERRFVRETTQRTLEAVTQGLSEQLTPLADEVARQRTRLEDLEGRATAITDERHRHEDATLDTARDDITFDSVSNALRLAQRTNALDKRFRVRCAPGLTGLRISLRPVDIEADGGQRRMLVGECFVLDGSDSFNIPWADGESAAGFADAVRRRLEQENIDASLFSPTEAFANLVSGSRYAPAAVTPLAYAAG